MNIKYANGDILLSPKKWLRGTLVPSNSRPGWSLVRINEDPTLYLSMRPDGTYQDPSLNDGPYEQCLLVGNNLVFEPRESGEDHIVPAVAMP